MPALKVVKVVWCVYSWVSFSTFWHGNHVYSETPDPQVTDTSKFPLKRNENKTETNKQTKQRVSIFALDKNMG